ncbi:unnamed protein product [Lactuca saligna]|uniref:Protein kinase domain-containing protein n=1 Tax=Lactuca saligna TaxID=75948 RepID=A0AA35Z2V3_LACSI|nr:unnamed protein product [Lactuca saligna]
MSLVYAVNIKRREQCYRTQQETQKILSFEHLKIKLEVITSATNNFADDNCIGRGGFGKVYKGKLLHSKGESIVALKRLDPTFGQGNPEFWKEIIMLSLYKHENIVSLLGFCDEGNEKILVYEYASKRSLDLYLNDDDLTWIERLKICIGAARGLAYLHNPGTIGYCDPIYVETGLLTKESDVHAFGVVLFEVLCGRLCTINKKDIHQPLTGLVRRCYKEKTINEIVFHSIRDGIKPKSLEAFITIAYRCLKRNLEDRPLMTDVVRTLESALDYQVDQLNTLSLKNDGGPGLSTSKPFEDDIEAEVNSYFHQMFSGQLTVDAMIQMLARYKESSEKREQSIFECVIANLFEEHKFFNKYPESQLKAVADLFGLLIKNKLLTHLTLGIALRSVLDALRKPADSKMFSFGTIALEKFLERLVEWPQYCQHILKISHLRDTRLELVTFIEKELHKIS